MADRPTVTTLTNSTISAATLNSNFTALIDAIEQGLGINGADGATNSMTGDLDMNGQTMRNVIIDGTNSTLPIITDEVTITPFMDTLLDDVDAATARATLGVASSVVTTRGDLILGDSSGDDSRLAIGTQGQVPTSDGTDLAYATPLHHGQCRLTLVGSNLTLLPHNGNKIVINNLVYTIPSGGAALAISGESSSTLYYIYLYDSSGTLTLESSTTVPTTDTTTGVEIKTGDATRTLVGMAYTTGGTAWADSVTQRFVLSYFNRKGKSLLNNFTTTRATSSASYVEINSEIRCEFICWDDEINTFEAGGSMGINTTQIGSCAVGFDGVTVAGTFSLSQAYTANATVAAQAAAHSLLSVGYHYATFLGGVSGGTATYSAACALVGTIQG